MNILPPELEVRPMVSIQTRLVPVRDEETVAGNEFHICLPGLYNGEVTTLKL